MEIRTETPSDYVNVYNVVKSAFATAEHADGTEQDLVVALRKSQSFIPKLSLVATINEDIVGHIMFTKAQIGDTEALILAPLAISPKHQKIGIGQALIKEGHKIAKTLGYKYIVVQGSEHYYPKSGYEKASKHDVIPPFETPEENFMVICLCYDDVIPSGLVKIAEEFGG